YNSAVYIDRGRIDRYHKTHVHWTEIFDAGDTFPVFGKGLDTTGILICYDMAFPEAARVLALGGARIIAVIAAVPKSFDERYVRRRLASMALDNQVYVVFANRAGRDYNGHSMVLDPSGDVIAWAGEKEEVLRTEIDFEFLEHWRKEEAIFSQRRPELYRLLAKP
ncbi:MAG: carbon-nitrogen hydrolase family protein, partial [Nitrospirales bacterium]